MVAALLAIVVIASAVFLSREDESVSAGVPDGTELTPSGRIVVTEDDTVIDRMDVAGPIYVKADNVRITNTRVTYGGYHAIRVFSGFSGLIVEDSEVDCTSEDGRGIAFGRYTARRVEISGCKRAFVTNAGNVTVVDSVVDGTLTNFSFRKGRASSVTATVPPETTTTAPAPTTTAPPAAPATTASPTPPTTAAPTEPDPGSVRVPAEQSIVDQAGPSNPGALRDSGSITVEDEGAVIENVRVDGTITVEANNVTIRNCEVRGFSNVAVIRTVSGITGTRIEHCFIEALPGADGAGPNGGVQGGKDTYVGYTEIAGYADGIKAEAGSLYEHNYIHMYKPAGSEKHLDGIQGSGDSNYTIRNNVIDQPIADGGNSAIFVQPYNGQRDYAITNITIEGNYLRGGNFTVFLEGDGLLSDITLRNNLWARDGNRYGYARVTNCGAVDAASNLFKDDRSVVPGTC